MISVYLILPIQDLANAFDTPLPRRRVLKTCVRVILFPLPVNIVKTPSFKLNRIYHIVK